MRSGDLHAKCISKLSDMSQCGHTQVLDMDDGLFTKSSSRNGAFVRVWDHSSVGCFGDPQTMDGIARGFR
jgi:hypothetical protein